MEQDVTEQRNWHKATAMIFNSLASLYEVGWSTLFLCPARAVSRLAGDNTLVHFRAKQDRRVFLLRRVLRCYLCFWVLSTLYVFDLAGLRL